MKKFTALLLIAAALITAQPLALAADASDDVVQQVIVSIGIMTGDQSGDMKLDSNVTRAEFAKMLVSASVYKDKVSSASNSSPFKDVPYTNWAAGYVKTAVQQGWLTGYLDGTYRPTNTVTLEEAATGCLKLLGYTTEDFAGSYPYGQLALYKSLGLDKRVTASQGASMTRRNMMYLFYNLLSADTKEGKPYGETLGYTIGADGSVDYLSVLSESMEGPFVVESSLDSIVSSAGRTVYRNGYASSADAIKKYDVVYYTGSSIWAYANAVTGTYQAASPSAASPTSVTVAGNSYTLGTGEATLSLSTLGELNIGDIVTLLLGRDGEVVAALSAEDYASSLAGVVTAVGSATYQTAAGNPYSARTVTVLATDGVNYTVPCDKTSITEGDFVSIGFGSSGTDVSILTSSKVTGKVSGRNIGSKTFAQDARILDVRDEMGVRVYVSRLNGATLESSDVRGYRENEAGEITDLILNDFTGDLYSYGIITSAREQSASMSLSGSYTYLVAGEEKKLSTNGSTLGAVSGPARLTIENGTLTSVRSLERIKDPDSITLLGVEKDGESHLFADDCAVYLYQNSVYSLFSLTELRNNLDSYGMTAYYDKETVDGGRIRIVVARPKT